MGIPWQHFEPHYYVLDYHHDLIVDVKSLSYRLIVFITFSCLWKYNL